MFMFSKSPNLKQANKNYVSLLMYVCLCIPSGDNNSWKG